MHVGAVAQELFLLNKMGIGTNILVGIIIGLVVAILYYLFLKYLDKIKLGRLEKNYNEEEDKSKQGESIRFTRPRDSGFKNRGTASSFDSNSLQSRRSLLPDIGKAPGDSGSFKRIKQNKSRKKLYNK